MKRRLLTLLLAAGALLVSAVTALTIPAAAQTHTVYVQLASGEIVPVQVDVPPGGNASGSGALAQFSWSYVDANPANVTTVTLTATVQ